jgi:hypothetical protein
VLAKTILPEIARVTGVQTCALHLAEVAKYLSVSFARACEYKLTVLVGLGFHKV